MTRTPPGPADRERLAEIDDMLERTGVGENSTLSDSFTYILTSLKFLRRLLDARAAPAPASAMEWAMKLLDELGIKPVPNDTVNRLRIVDLAAALTRARAEALREAAKIAHRHCWLPAVGVREDNAAARIEDAILVLIGGPPQDG